MATTSTTNSQEEMMEEGIGDFIRLGTLLTLLAVPGILKAEDISQNLPKTDKITAQDVTNAIEKVDAKQKSYGGYSATQASNIVARTLYMEARSEGTNGLNAVASVIMNRAGKKAENLPGICLAEKQFSCWNDKPNLDAKTYVSVIPKGAAKEGKDQDAWKYCQTLAGKLMNEEFKSTIDNRNCYHTTKVKPYWDAKMRDKKTIGKHVFGYLPEHDGERKAKRIAAKKATTTKTTAAKTVSYKVKDGDILSRIAKKNKTTVAKILDVNPNLKKNPNFLKVGATINIPQ